MSKKKFETVELRLQKIVGGGQALGMLPDGRKLFVWGGLPGELVTVQLTKKKSSFAEGVVTEVLEPSSGRIAPKDPGSYLSTSPWQIMNFEDEQRQKAELIKEAFELHGVPFPKSVDIFTDNREYHYRNKVEFSWYSDTISGVDTLDLAFFRRGSKGKIVVEDSALLPPEMLHLAHAIRDHLRSIGVTARQLKTLLIRCDQEKNCVWQLYVKDTPCAFADSLIQADLPAQGGEIIYSNPKSPASVITERLASTGNVVLTDAVLGVPFRYATEGFFQVNLPVYEKALKDIREWVAISAFSPTKFSETASRPLSVDPPSAANGAADVSENLSASGWSSEDTTERVTRGGAAPTSSPREVGADRAAGPAASDLRANSGGIRNDGSGEESAVTKGVVDLYSGVGSIGLTIGGPGTTLVEINEHAVREMKRNIKELGIDATPVLAASERALDHITSDKIIIVDPPRAGLHADVITKLLEAKPTRIIYLSCNPVTQARDIGLLNTVYELQFYKGYNFFPRTPHIEGLAVLGLA